MARTWSEVSPEFTQLRLRDAHGGESSMDQVVLQAADDPSHRLVVFVPAT